MSVYFEIYDKVSRMNVALRRPMTIEDFLDWVEGQSDRFEFNGFEPVAMTGGTNNHGIISGNIYVALRQRLIGRACRPMNADSGGVATVGGQVRFPDATVTCTNIRGTDRLIPAPVVVFEVVSQTSSHLDHVTKAIEYRTVPSIQRYVIVEQSTRSLRILHRIDDADWIEDPILTSGMLELPEIDASIDVDEIYDRVDIQQ